MNLRCPRKTIDKNNPFKEYDPTLCRIFNMKEYCFRCKVAEILYDNEIEKPIHEYKEGEIQWKTIYRHLDKSFGVEKFITGYSPYIKKETWNSDNSDECKIKKEKIEAAYKDFLNQKK